MAYHLLPLLGKRLSELDDSVVGSALASTVGAEAGAALLPVVRAVSTVVPDLVLTGEMAMKLAPLLDLKDSVVDGNALAVVQDVTRAVAPSYVDVVTDLLASAMDGSAGARLTDLIAGQAGQMAIDKLSSIIQKQQTGVIDVCPRCNALFERFPGPALAAAGG